MKSNRILLLLIFLFGLFWRFYNYPNRWVLNQDQARDVTIALYALQNHQLPLLGSPSSAGPFNFGALYFWLVSLVTFIFPFSSGPWVAFTLISTFNIIIFYLIGKSLGSQKLALILSLIAAFSTREVSNSPDMLNTVITSPASALAILFTVKFIKSNQIRFAIFQGFCIGLAQNFHFQSLGLFSLMLATFIIQKSPFSKKVLYGITAAFGWFISFIPNFYFDLTHHFAWSQSVISYYTSGVNKFYVPIRWLTDIRDFWPQLWGLTITGAPYLGYLLIPLFIFAIFKTNRSVFTILFSFLIQVLLLRYYKGVRSPEYLIFLHPYFILFTGFTLFTLLQRYFKLTLVLFSLILVITSYSNFKAINQLSQSSSIYKLKNALDIQYPGPINLYSYDRSNMASLPIFYLLYRENRISDQGTKIGVAINSSGSAFFHLPIKKDYQYQLIDLQNPTSEFENYTPQKIYQWLYVNY